MKKLYMISLCILITLGVKSQSFFKLGASLSNHSSVWVQGDLGWKFKGNNMVSVGVYTNMTRNTWVAAYGTDIFKRINGQVGLALAEQKVSPYVAASYKFKKRYYVGLAFTDKQRFISLGVKFRK